MSRRAALRATVTSAPVLTALLLGAGLQPAHAVEVTIPVLVPVTGFLAVEGSSQRNGAVLALKNPPAGVTTKYSVIDTGTSPEVAVNALERAVADGGAIAAVAPMLGTQMLALLPIAEENKLPLITISGTAAITQQHNPWIFRFFPDDATVTNAQVRFALEEKHVKKPAVIYQTDAYGQSGHAEIDKWLKKSGITPVYEDALDANVKDMAPTLQKARAAGADSLLLHLHGESTALLLKEAAAENLHVPIVAGSGLSQPATTALLQPSEIAGVCAETGASPESEETPAMHDFVVKYRAEFNGTPDSFALNQYDATMMVLNAVAHGARTPEDVRKVLSTESYPGLAMTYKSDGMGNMAHSAVIICFDGKTRVPYVAKHYDLPATN